VRRSYRFGTAAVDKDRSLGDLESIIPGKPRAYQHRAIHERGLPDRNPWSAPLSRSSHGRRIWRKRPGDPFDDRFDEHGAAQLFYYQYIIRIQDRQASGQRSSFRRVLHVMTINAGRLSDRRTSERLPPIAGGEIFVTVGAGDR
jgi:hypothetical protein